MEPYFIKFLPEDKDVTLTRDQFEGTRYLFWNNGLYGNYSALSSSKERTILHPLNGKKGFSVLISECIVAKPFLCDRDIRAGDLVKFQLVPNKTDWKTLRAIDIVKDLPFGDTLVLADGEYRLYVSADQYCVKVIGELPDYSWFWEGYELSSDKVKLMGEIKFETLLGRNSVYIAWVEGKDYKKIAYVKDPWGKFSLKTN